MGADNTVIFDTSTLTKGHKYTYSCNHCEALYVYEDVAIVFSSPCARVGTVRSNGVITVSWAFRLETVTSLELRGQDMNGRVMDCTMDEHVCPQRIGFDVFGFRVMALGW